MKWKSRSKGVTFDLISVDMWAAVKEKKHGSLQIELKRHGVQQSSRYDDVHHISRDKDTILCEEEQEEKFSEEWFKFSQADIWTIELTGIKVNAATFVTARDVT